MAVTMEDTVIWDVMPCDLVNGKCQYLGGGGREDKGTQFFQSTNTYILDYMASYLSWE